MWVKARAEVRPNNLLVRKMFIYSKKISAFVNAIKESIKKILSENICVKVVGNRFYTSENFSYPISVVVYNNKAMLGYFEQDFYELGFHECLMHSSKEQLLNVIRHELAHYMTFIKYGNSITPHAIEFKNFCLQMGWGEEVYKATTCWDGTQNVTELSNIFRKIQKLMALATSSNQNEAEQAMIKSQQLLLKHNLATPSARLDDDEPIFLKRIMKQKKENAKMRSIAKILETFFVSIVYLRGKDHIYLEILGSAMNIEIAEYVADILQDQLDKLWEQTKKEHLHLKGLSAKNSFFLGIARGYCNKIHALKKEYNSEDRHALILIEKKLIDAKAFVYPRLSSSKSHGSYCPEASILGEQVGRQLNINPAIASTAKNFNALLTYK